MPDPYSRKSQGQYTKKLRSPYEDRPNLHRYGTRYIREAHELHHHPGMLRHYPDITAHERFLRKHARETKKGGTRRRRYTRRR